MRLDPVVRRRFAELAEKADSVSRLRKHEFTSSDDGVAYFKVPSPAFKEWATNVQSLLARTVGDDSAHYVNFVKISDKFAGWESSFEECRAIFNAAREDYEGGYLFNVRALAKAEVLADAIQQAKEVNAAGYKDLACILARVALESALKDLTERHGLAVGKLDRMNADLAKAGVYNTAKQKQVTAWADIGNKAAHGAWDEYTIAEARAMVEGVEALVADLM